jgi:uncharacterized protein (DUF2147 family)
VRRAMVLLLALSTGAVFAGNDRGAVMGKWASDTSIIEVSEGGGALHAKIISVLDPLFKANEDGPAGTTRSDVKNPDAALRARPLVGIDLLSDYAFKSGKWQGSLYDPESGKTYKSTLSVSSDGKLEMRGYIGTPMFGRTEEWDPLSACSGNIPKLLANAQLPPCG